MTIVYDEKVVTKQTTGGGVTKTLTETLIHYPALPPVPPITFTVPRTSRSSASRPTITNIVAPTTVANEVVASSIVVVTSRTTQSVTTTTMTQTGGAIAAQSSVLQESAAMNAKAQGVLAVMTWQGVIFFCTFVVTSHWLITGDFR